MIFVKNSINTQLRNLQRSLLRLLTRTTTLQGDKGPRKALKRAWERPPVVVAKRNARERTRVHAVNQAFVTLKYHLPSIRSNAKRVSKLKILRTAISYIAALTDLLHDNAECLRLAAQSYCCSNSTNNLSRSQLQNEALVKDSEMKREEQQLTKSARPNVYGTTQCYNPQYWLSNHPYVLY